MSPNRLSAGRRGPPAVRGGDPSAPAPRVSFSLRQQGRRFQLGQHVFTAGHLNNLGLSINATALNYSLDLGGGWESGAGLNSLFGNVGGQVSNGAAATLLAENNWWGAAPPNAALILGTVDFVPWLLSDPN